MSFVRGRGVLRGAAAVVVVGVVAGPAAAAVPPATFSSDLGSVTAKVVSSCGSSNGLGMGMCADGAVVGAPTLRLTRGTLLTVRAQDATTPVTELTFFDPDGRPFGRAPVIETFAPLPAGTGAQFSLPPNVGTGSYAAAFTKWQTANEHGDALYAVRLELVDAPIDGASATPLAPAHVHLLRLVLRASHAPVLLLHASTAGQLTLRWHTGRTSRTRTLQVRAGLRRVMLPGVPRAGRRVTVSATLRPTDGAHRGTTAARTFRARL